MITYYIVGHWMGQFRTVSKTETLERFHEWAAEWHFTKDDKGVWRNGRDFVVVESITAEDESEI